MRVWPKSWRSDRINRVEAAGISWAEKGKRVISPELRDIDFHKIRSLVFDLCGIDLHEGKKELVKARLGKRLREGRFKSFKDYFQYVMTDEGADELIAMIDSLSTNLTSFFREDSHFRKFGSLVPVMLDESDRARLPSRRIPKFQVWCAGCSTGEEAYSIGMTFKEALAERVVDFRIWATDISTRVLKTAVAGIYSEEKIRKIPAELLRRYFAVGQGNWAGHYRVKKILSDVIEFARFNLMDIPPPGDPFDVIFCRNVMIYFDKMTQAALVRRFYDRLKVGGYLFVGHSESLTGLSQGFKYIEPSVYRK